MSEDKIYRQAQKLAERLRAERFAKKAVLIIPRKGKVYGGGSLIDDYLESNGVAKELFDKQFLTKAELDAYAHSYARSEEEKLPEDFLVWKRWLIRKRYLVNYELSLDDKQPPKNAEYLAQLFLPKANREALLGDLVEEYPGMVAKFGVKRAKFNFYVHVIFSILILVRNSVVKWGLFGWVVEVIRKIGS